MHNEVAVTQGRVNVNAYNIFPTATLKEMAVKYPTTLEEFSQLEGVGERKTASFGQEFYLLMAMCLT